MSPREIHTTEARCACTATIKVSTESYVTLGNRMHEWLQIHTHCVPADQSETLADAWNAGWNERYLEERRQRDDSSHPITRNNPHEAKV